MYKLYQRPIFKAFIVLNGLNITYWMYREGKYNYNKAQHSYLYENLNTSQKITQEYLKLQTFGNVSLYSRTKLFIRTQWRLLQLVLIFTPAAILFPIAFIFKKYLFDAWLRLLIITLDIAGPLWVKLGQWASHRSDIIGDQICQTLSQLRDASSAHSFKQSKLTFYKAFNQNIEDAFNKLETIPIASGSIGQVYLAEKDGQQVAIKIRHPQIIEKLLLDLKLLYQVSNFLSSTIGIFKQLAMPVTFQEFSMTLMNQADFRFEASNLDIFNENFKDSTNIIFPKVIRPYVADSVLVETYESGVPLSTFMQQNPRTKEHRIVGNLGLKAFYKMLIYDNFIHADLHAGNMIVRITENPIMSKQDIYLNNLYDNFYEIIENTINYILPFIERNLFGIVQNKSVLEKEKQADEKQFWNFWKISQASKCKVDLIFIDPGMVTILNHNDRVAFIKLIMYVALRKPKECGELMLSLAQYQQLIKPERRLKFLQDIEGVFTKVCSVPLAQMNLGIIFKEMLDILRVNQLQIEGHFATLLTNMMILEGTGRNLDPDMNIVSKAASFLLHMRSIDATINELIVQRQ